LLGSECRVHVEFNEDGMPETLKGKGVNMSKNFCVMFYIGGELHFLTNAIKDIEIPHEMKDNLPLFFKKTHTQHVKEVETVDPQQNIKKVAFESDNLDKENAGPINVNIDGINTFKTPEGILANPVKREASKSKAKKSKRSKSKSKSPTKKKAKKTRSKSPIKKGKKGKTTKKGTKTQGPADKTADKNKFISNDDPEARNLEIKPMEISQIGFETHNLSAMSSNVKRLNTKSSRQTTEPDNEMYEAYYLWKVGGNKETEVILIDQWVDKDTNEENFLFECADSTVQVSFKE